MSEKELKNKMDTFIECYKNGMIFGPPTDIEFYEKIATLQQKIEEKNKEIDRLNNILDELEKYLIEHIDEYRDMEQDAMFEFGLVLDKLKTLKENNK